MDYPFVTVTGWPAHHNPARASIGHSRSLSSIIKSSNSNPASVKSSSSAESPNASAESSFSHPATPQPKRVLSPQPIDDENDLNTLPDPRSRAMSPSLTDGMASPQQPDLNDEVTALSTKLISALNHQTTLDDTLSATRVELEASLDKIRQLEAQVESQREMLAGDVWVRRKTVESEKTKLLSRVTEEKKAREEVEQQKKKIEQELENLTAALFEEANKMVIQAKEDARAEQEALQRKNDQLRAQLVDTEGLLKSQQEQLVELKQVMEQMSFDRDDQTVPTVPSSPGFSKFDNREDDRQSDGIGSQPMLEPLSPTYPTSLTHLLQPVLRTDTSAFLDFRDLIRTTKRLSGVRAPITPAPSGLSALGIGLGSAGSFGNGSTTSLSPSGTAATNSPQTPNTPASSLSTGSGAQALNIPALKDTKFYKRAVAEDIEPTLRLDTAPGLSWLARRAVLTAMTDGSLVVEPVPITKYSNLSKPQLYPCSLCGESRKEEEHLRNHRFRTSESTSAQRYPLCKYCLGRVRSTCDFLGFLRIVKDGHWRADDEDAEKGAWEESVRLREQMFWSRIGGGVLPTSHTHQLNSSTTASLRGDKSPRVSQEEDKLEQPEPKLDSVDEKEKTPGVQETAANPSVEEPEVAQVDAAAEGVKDAATEVPEQDRSARNSTQSLSPEPETDAPKSPRLSLTIPVSLNV